MSALVGRCLRFYVDHYQDMAALEGFGSAPPKDVSRETWRKVRDVGRHAGFQAVSLLTKCATQLIAEVKKPNERVIARQDQKTTLNKHWTIRLSVSGMPPSDSFAQVGFSIDVPRDGRGEVVLWIASWSTSKTVQRSLLDVLHASGSASAVAINQPEWPRHWIALGRLPMTNDLDEGACKGWVEDTARRGIVEPWLEMRRLLEGD